MVVFNEEKQQKKVEQLRKEEEENLARALSANIKLDILISRRCSVNSDALRVIS
jgi:hypothetical protein